jgi:hypothetical protein
MRAVRAEYRVMKSQTAEIKRSTRGTFPLANLLLT